MRRRAGPIERVHARFAHPRRVEILARRLAPLLPPGRALDVGTGDGRVAAAIARERPDVEIQGVDVLVRADAAIPVEPFDGRRLPYDDDAFAAITLVDVVHHAHDGAALLRECARVAPVLVLKDHTRDGLVADATLRFMDRVGNVRHGVSLPYSYWPRETWLETFAGLGLRVTDWRSRLGLYPPPAAWLFERSLHFVARVER